nr:metalloreductase STEAP4-like [Cherax quadricarinatus]XP_053654631.1 metalloreductase STEAP4-like [Cherax quadricarinatus]XP_053654632.1 metalloreductase STEAP4-like [Cherax quadricarinatus]
MEMINQFPEANHSHIHVSQDDHKNPGHTSKMDDRRVVLVGSGDMTRALVGSLLRAGFNPVVATRNPTRAKTWLSGDEVKVCTVEEGLSLGDLVVVAIPAAHHNSLPTDLLANKIVIDISNRSPEKPPEGLSLAEKLQAMLPESQVIKALNTMSAYVLQTGNLHSGREVPVCGGTTAARTRVMAMVREMGLAPVDMGGLKNARTLEDIPLSFFPEWKVAAIITGIVFMFFWILTLFK